MADDSTRLTQSVNPYESSRQPNGVTEPKPTVTETSPPRYKIRMAWADRHRFLRSVGLLRFSAVGGAFLGVAALYWFFSSAHMMWQLAQTEWGVGWTQVVRYAFSLLRGAVALYLCWLNWKLADALAATAGGRTAEMREWSKIQLMLARLTALTIILGIVSVGWEWIEGHLILRRVSLD